MRRPTRILVAAIPLLVVLGLIFARKSHFEQPASLKSEIASSAAPLALAGSARKAEEAKPETGMVRVETQPAAPSPLSEVEKAQVDEHLKRLQTGLHQIEAENMQLIRKEEIKGHFRGFLKIESPTWEQLNRMNAAVDLEASAFAPSSPAALAFAAAATSKLQGYTRFPEPIKVVHIEIPLEDDSASSVTELWVDQFDSALFSKSDVAISARMISTGQVKNTPADWAESHYGPYFPMSDLPPR